MATPDRLYQMADRLDAPGQIARARELRREARAKQEVLCCQLRKRTKALANANFGQTVDQWLLELDAKHLGTRVLAKKGRS